MTRQAPLPLLFAATLLVVGCPAEVPGPAPLTLEEQLVLAEADYQVYCALCHGATGEGYAADSANALSNPAFLATASDELLRTGITRGRPGTPMSAWGVDQGGPLDDDAVERIVLLIRSWQQGEAVDVSGIVVEGEAARGKAQYGARCAGCHGPEGEGGLFMSLNNPEFLNVVSDGYLREAIASGRPLTAMSAYTGVLTEQAIDDLVVLIRSWQRPVDTGKVALPSADLADATIHPDGPDPTFGEELYIPADEVKAQLDAGAAMILIDARPPADYSKGHITGAVSVPFYEAATLAAELPPEVTVVAYCGCPHAESTIAAEALIAAGREQVKVLDEGYYVWVERGYPVTLSNAQGAWQIPDPPPEVPDTVEDTGAGDIDAADAADADSEVGPTADGDAPQDVPSEADAQGTDTTDAVEG